jgi:hypothetical protein
MNMLILKKKIIFINIKKSYNKILQTKLIYYFIRNKLVILVSFPTCSFNKYNIFTKNLDYSYTLKWNCSSTFILNSKLNSLVEFFYNVKDTNSIKTLNHFSNSKYFISVIRSPFVYKKSMEQFFFNEYIIYYKTDVLAYNFFFHNYQYTNLKNILQKKIFLKLFCKITFTFN